MNALQATPSAASAEKKGLTARLAEAHAALESEHAERRRLEAAVIEAADQERRRLAQMLHDTVCQSLSGIVLLSRVILRGVEIKCPEVAPEVAELGVSLDCAVREIHSLVRCLRLSGEDGLELVPALTELAQSVSPQIPCDFECPEPVAVGDRFASAQLAQIAYEAVNRALRRTGISRIVVTLSIQDRRVTLVVRDDGQINTAGEPAAGSIAGMELMQLRASAMGATLSNSFHASQGTTITCTLPRAT